MTMYNALHPRDHTVKLSVSRKEGGRELTSIEDCRDSSIQGLEEYIKKSIERRIKAANSSNGNRTTDKKTTKTRKQK